MVSVDVKPHVSSSVQFGLVPRPIGSSGTGGGGGGGEGGHEGRFSRVFSAGGRRERLWHGQLVYVTSIPDTLEYLCAVSV